MIRIMIVDDMPIFLEYLRGFINWEEYGFEICAQAENGKEAYDKIEECYPDVILTDITMPYMDGLELAESVIRDYPDISVILITGNNEFEYARKALKIGVCDYIVKPFEKEELLLSLLKLQDNVNKVIENTDVAQTKEEEEKDRLLRSVFIGKHDAPFDWEKELSSVGVSLISPYFLVGCIRMEIGETKDLEDFLNWENILSSMLKDALRVSGTYHIFKDVANNIVFLLNFEDEAAQTAYRAYELIDFPKIIERRLGLPCRIGISNFCKGNESIRDSYYEVLEALEQGENGRIVRLFEKKAIKRVSGEQYYIPLHLTELSDALTAKDKETFSKLWKKEWENNFAYADEGMALQLFSTLLALLLTDIISSGDCIDNVYGEDFRPYSELYMIFEMEKKVEKLFLYYEMWMDIASKKQVSQSKSIAEKARSYIQIHYMEGDLSILDISEELFINQTYLRKMFKEEMGMTLSEYITKYRMHMAKQLLLNTDYSQAQIAEKVGYNDVCYFNKCFKKYYKVSPKQMTKQHYQSVD